VNPPFPCAGGLYLLDLGSSHGSHVDGQRLRPHERCGPLPNGAVLAFGASSRHYTLRGLVADTGGVVAAAAPADSRLAQLLAVAGELGGDEDVAGEGGGAGRKRAAGQRKAMHPKKLAKKNRKWLCAAPPRLGRTPRSLHPPLAAPLQPRPRRLPLLPCFELLGGLTLPYPLAGRVQKSCRKTSASPEWPERGRAAWGMASFKRRVNHGWPGQVVLCGCAVDDW